MERTQHNFYRLNSGDFVAIYDWMGGLGGLDLTASELRVYSLVYSFSSNIAQGGNFRGSIDYLSCRLHMSQSSVKRALQSLIERKLIYIKGHIGGAAGKKRPVYVVNVEAAQEAIASFHRYWSQEGIARDKANTEQAYKECFEPLEDALIPDDDTQAQLHALEETTGNSERPKMGYLADCSGETATAEKSPENGTSDQALCGCETETAEDVPEDAPQNAERPKLSHSIETGKGNDPETHSEQGKREGSTPDGEAGAKWPKMSPDIKGFGLENHPTRKVDGACSLRSGGRTDGWLDMAKLENSVLFDRMVAASINRNNLTTTEGRASTREALDRLIAEGYEAQRICEAWESLCAEQKSQKTPARFCKQLLRWLTYDARSACRKAQARDVSRHAAGARAPKPVQDPEEEALDALEREDGRFAAMRSGYRNAIVAATRAQIAGQTDAASLRADADARAREIRAYAVSHGVVACACAGLD